MVTAPPAEKPINPILLGSNSSAFALTPNIGTLLFKPSDVCQSSRTIGATFLVIGRGSILIYPGFIGGVHRHFFLAIICNFKEKGSNFPLVFNPLCYISPSLVDAQYPKSTARCITTRGIQFPGRTPGSNILKGWCRTLENNSLAN